MVVINDLGGHKKEEHKREIYSQLKKSDGKTHFFFCNLPIHPYMDLIEDVIDEMSEMGYEVLDVRLSAQGNTPSRSNVVIVYK